MDNKTLTRWFYAHMLYGFFADFSSWFEDVADTMYRIPALSLCAAADTEAVTTEYDRLFIGTYADTYIPLWASACVGDEDTLLDKTTLSVIESYYQHGYRPIDIDGNPPDFIGQQLRFFAYLSAVELGGNDAEIRTAREEFTRQYFLPTAEKAAQGIRKYSGYELFLEIADMLLDVAHDTLPQLDAVQIECVERLLAESDFADVYRNGRDKPVKLSPPEIIAMSGRNNCGGKCVIAATVQEGCVLSLLRGADEKLQPCARGMVYHKLYLSGRRLRYPMIRVGERGEGKFRRVSWDEAATHIAEQWARIRDEYGAASRYVGYGYGVSAAIGPTDIARRLLNIDGGHLAYGNTYSYACTYHATPLVYGNIHSGNSTADILNTKFLLLWGHNPVETIFDSERRYYLSKLRERGVRMVVIDPRYSDTAAIADEWIGIKPSTDGALADAMAYVILTERLADTQFMETYCIGFDETHMPDGVPPNESYQAYLFGRQDGIEKTPHRAERITGVPADTIVRLAREYATAKPACLMPGYGVQRTGNGEQTTRALAMLACLTGNVGIPGGGAAGMGSVKEMTRIGMPTLKNRVKASIPFFLWTKAIERGSEMTARDDGVTGADKLDCNVKMLINFAGNPLNQHSDMNNTARILKDTDKCEFIICSDVFMTPSAKFADVLLPAASPLECDNIVFPWSNGAYLLYGNQLVQPLFGSRFEYDVMCDVARKLGHLEKFSGGHESHKSWLSDIYNRYREKNPDMPDYESFKRDGVYRFKNEKPYIAYEDEVRDPENYPFSTPSGKIEIFSPRLYAMDAENIPAIPKYTPCPEGPEDPLRDSYPLQLIGWHTKRSTHSIHFGGGLLEKLEPHRLWINPHDAEARGVSDGETVEVYNARGRVRILAMVTERIIPGVVAIPQGAWYNPDEDGVDIGGSVNVLTAFRPTPSAHGNPQHTNLVEVIAMHN